MQCPVRLSYRDSQPAEGYEATQLLEWLESHIPRFRQPGDILLWMEDDDSSYILGVVATCIVICGILFLWSILLLYLSCKDPKKTGLWSGHRPKVDPPTKPQAMQEKTLPHNLSTEIMPGEDGDLFLSELLEEEPDPFLEHTPGDLEATFSYDGHDALPLPPLPKSPPRPSSPPTSPLSLPFSPQTTPQDNGQDQTMCLNTSKKYDEYRNYLQEAASARPALTLLGEEDESDENDDSAMDSDDFFLSFTNSSDDGAEEKKDDKDDIYSSILDLSFPKADDEEFLFEDAIEEGEEELTSDDDSGMSTLPQSKFISKAACRKRLLENYVEAFRSSNSVLSASQVLDTTAVADLGMLIDDDTVEPIASIFENMNHEGSESSPLQKKKQVRIEEEAKHQKSAEQSKADYEQARKHWVRQQIRYDRQLQRFRIFTVFASTLLIVATLLFILNGVWNLDMATNNILSSWAGVQQTSDKALGFLKDLQHLQASVLQQTWNIWQLLDQHCPTIRPEGVCPNSNCNVSGLPLEDTWDGWLQFVVPSNVAMLYQGENWTAVEEGLMLIKDQPVESTLVAWHWALWATCACNALLALLVFGIMWGISLPYGQKYILSFAQSRLFCIVFWILTILSLIFGMGFLIGTVLTADVCAESPNHVAHELLGRGRLDIGPIEEYLTYFIDGCQTEDFPGLIEDRVWLWANLLPPTQRLVNSLERFPTQIFEQVCGSSVDPLVTAASTLSLQVCMVTQSLVSCVYLCVHNTVFAYTIDLHLFPSRSMSDESLVVTNGFLPTNPWLTTPCVIKERKDLYGRRKYTTIWNTVCQRSAFRNFTSEDGKLIRHLFYIYPALHNW